MDSLATFFVSLMYGFDHIPDFLIDRTGTQYKLICKKDIIDILRAKNRSRQKLLRKMYSSSSISSTPGGGTNTTPSTTVTVDEGSRQHAEEQQDDDDSYSDNDNEDANDDNDDVFNSDISSAVNNQNNDNSEQQQGYIEIHVQSDFNEVNLNQVDDDTSIRQLLVKFYRFLISNVTIFNYF
jgi:hypothetical protein